jgi:polar amino acid transport system substrate-binding protein
MRITHIVSSILLLLASGDAVGACTPLRTGYIDQHRPPYYLGNGPVAPEPPGASIELLRDIAASVGCTIAPIRLPSLRLRSALAGGALDMIPLVAIDADIKAYAFPRDAQGQLDHDKALRSVTMVFIRASDKLPRNTDPSDYFRGRRLGLTHGAPYAAELRRAGIVIDEGALDTLRSFEKLKRKRLDGFAVALTAPGDMDAFVAANFGDDIVRLDKPLRSSYIWLAVNHDFYRANRALVDGMWTWIGSNGRTRFDHLLKKYDRAM